jgi:ATP-binding cassette subfamily F protein 3
LLDEPTNHLDIPSQEILESVLEDYKGTILLITHDRYLVDALATQIWEIDPDDGHLTVFKGTYSELRAEREQKQYEEFMAAQNSSNEKRVKNNEVKSVKSKAETKEERRKIAKVQELENQIAELESTLANLGFQLESPMLKPDDVVKISKEYERVQKEMDVKLAEWEGMQTQ